MFSQFLPRNKLDLGRHSPCFWYINGSFTIQLTSEHTGVYLHPLEV